MKKDIYPDVRIEIISEGLTKKILESSGSPAPSVYGEEQPEGKNLPNVGIKGKNKELQSVLETSNKKPTYTGLVKEAIQELRKDAHDKEKPAAKINYGDTKNPEAFTRISDEFGSDDYQNPDKFISPTQVRENTGISPSATGTRTFGNQPLGEGIYGEGLGGRAEFKRRAQVADKKSGIESQVASQTQNMVKEAIQELRKAPQGGQYGDFQPGGTTKRKEAAPVPTRENVYEEFDRMGGDTTSSRRPESTPSVAPSDRADVKEAIASADAPVTSRENVYQEAQEAGITPYGPYQTYGGGTAAPTGEEAPFGSGSPYSRTAEGLGSGTTESIDYRPQDKKTTAKETSATDISDLAARTGTGRVSGTRDPKGFDASAVSALAAREAAAPTGGGAKKEEDKSGTPTPTLVGGPDVDEDVIEGRASGTLPLDESTEGVKGTEGTGDVDATASEIATNVTGIEPEEEEESSTPEIDPKVTSELGLGVRANPELTRPKNSKGDLLPQFGSSGYFDAIVSIGEGGENVEANYGVSNLSDFLSLYAQNPQFDQTKFETNFKIEQKADIEKANPFKASLKKQAPPMAMTMNRPPNMGVGQQQPVVTGAGTMKNTEKAVAANKPAATPAKTKARRRKPKTIEMMVKSIANRVG